MSIYRGVGGSGNATDDATIAEVSTLASSAATSASNAASSAAAAASSAYGASSSATSAANSATNASFSSVSAASSASFAASSVPLAAAEADAAAASAVAAASSASSASTSASNAASSAASAASARDSAEVYKLAAETAETNAEAAYANTLAIYGDTTDVAAAVAAASSSASSASSSATAAASSASSASTSAANAANSATAALVSQNAAATSASNAQSTYNALQATVDDAVASAVADADAFADAALVSANNAAVSASTATTQASSANASAGSAAGSAAQALAIYGNTAAVQTAVNNANAAASLAQGYAASASSVVQQDLSGVNAAALHRSPNAVTAMFIYDTSKDSDGGAWTEKCQHTSWYNEDINGKWLGAQASEAAARVVSGATTGDYFQLTTDGKFYRLNAGSGTTEVFRGNKRDFPRLAGIVAEAANVTIYDLTEPGRPMWMRFLNGSAGSTPLGWNSGNITSAAALSGVVSVGMTGNGVINFDLAKDATYLFARGEWFPFSPQISRRNSPVTAASGAPLDKRIAAYGVNAVAMTVLPGSRFDPVTNLPNPTIAVATAGGVSIIKDNGTVVNSSSTLSWDAVYLTQAALLARRNEVSYFATNPSGLAASFAMSEGSSAGFISGGNSVSGNYPTRTSYRRGMSGAVKQLRYNQSTNAAGVTNHITNTFNTGHMIGDIKRTYLSDNVVESVSGSELVTNGTFDTDTTGWQLFGNTAITSENGTLRIESLDTQYYHAAIASISTSIGGVYKLSVEFRGGTQPHVIVLKSNSNSNWDEGRVDLHNGIPPTAGTVKTINFTANATTTFIWLLLYGTQQANYYFDNVSVVRYLPDRSYKAKGASITGTLTKTQVASATDLVCYSGFSASNYLREPYSSDLDFGTGEWSVGAWVNVPAANAAAGTIACREHSSGAYIRLGIDATNKLTATAFDGTTTRTVTTSAAYNTATWAKVEACYTTDGTLSIRVNGVEVAATRGNPLLSMNSRYNQWANSEDVSVAGDPSLWRATFGLKAFGSGSTVNAAIAPNGTTTADLIVEDTSNGAHRTNTLQWTDFGTSPTTISVHMKQGVGSRYGYFGVYSNVSDRYYLVVDLATGAFNVDTAGTGIVASASGVQSLGSGWYRAYITFTESLTYTAAAVGMSNSSTSVATYTGDGSSGIYLWGAQLESGATLRTYQRTSATAAETEVAPLTIGNSYALDAPFPGSIALLKLSATVPTAEQSQWMYEQEKQLFRTNAKCCLPDSGSILDLTYDDATDKWIAISATNESEWSGLVRTSVTAVPAGSYSKAAAASGVQLLARTTTSPGVDITIPAYGLREELVKRAEAAAKLNAQLVTFDYVGGFTATTVTGNTAITSVAGLTYPTSYIGARVSGSGIPANTTIVAVSGTTIYLSAAATASASNVQVSFVDYALPVGYEAKEVSLAGVAQREGSTSAFTRLFDGFKETIRFGTAPAYNALIQIQAARSAA